MGSIYSDGLEMADPVVVRNKYQDLIATAMHEGQYFFADQLLDELAVVEPMVETYLQHVSLPFIEREVEFLGTTAHGFQDNGRMDGIGHPLTEGDHLLIVENKLKGRWGAGEIVSLAGDDQITSYVLNASKHFDMDPNGIRVRYEVAKKPALRQGKMTREAFRARVSADIRARPDFYHWVSEPLSRTEAQLSEWEVLFERMARDIASERALEAREDPGAWPKNPDACYQYGGCSMLKVCWEPDPEQVGLYIEKTFTTPEERDGA